MVDNVRHPSHYEWLKDAIGVEPIDIASHLSYCRGNAIKYILRAGRKAEEGMTTAEKEIEDLRKAVYYLRYEIKELKLELNESNNHDSSTMHSDDSSDRVR
jgi:hypothetical protein